VRAAPLLALLLAACTTTLERDLDEAQADEVVVALGEHGIGATKEPERGGAGFSIVVAEGDVASALAVLQSEGLPRTDAPGIAEAYAEPSLIPTAGEERARLAQALGADLARSIEALAGVHRARVHVGLPDPSALPLDARPEHAVASVLVQRAPGADLDEAAIRSLVAGAVPGLAPEHVTIVTSDAPAPDAHAVPLARIGPLSVTQSSATPLRMLLGAMLSVNVVLAAAVALVLRRRR
jgi:type III secretion protein J